MSKFIMTLKSISVFFILAVFVFSCSNDYSANKISKELFSDTTVYPKQDYSSVTLFVLDSFEKDGKPFYPFVDTTGQPKTKNFRSYKLDSMQIKRLQSFLMPQPCSDSLVIDKNCAPIFRHVFIFQNKGKKQVSQVYLCFQCEMSSLFPDEDYMCNFDNKVNWTLLKSYVNSIKQAK